MAVQWMADHAHKMPPVEFAEILLSVTLPAEADAEITDLLARKARSAEKMGQGRYPALDAYIRAGIDRGRLLADQAPAGRADKDALDALFRVTVEEVAGEAQRSDEQRSELQSLM